MCTPEIIELNDKTFYDTIARHPYVVVHFWACWNGYDVAMKKLIEDEIYPLYHPRVKFGRMDIDPEEHHPICKQHSVVNVPHFVYYYNGRLLNSILGVRSKEQLLDDIEVLLSGNNL